MKKIFLNILIVALLLTPAIGFAVPTDTEAEEAADKTLATLEPEKSSTADELQKADKDTLKEEDFFVDETKSSPVATVSGDEKVKDLVPSGEFQAAPASVTTSKTSPSTIPEKKSVESRPRSEASAAFNTAEMKERWKALFSKEVGPDSISYTVKPGDSLYVIARKNHTTVDFIKKINDLKSDNIYPKMKLKIHTAPLSIVVDKSKNTLVLYSSNQPVKKYSVATGKNNCTPVGEFKIKDKLVNPTWFKTGAILPPGSPENALGTRWMGFDKPGYGIHGTIEPKSIGTQTSEGCIRMMNEDVEELYSLVPFGAKVTVQD